MTKFLIPAILIAIIAGSCSSSQIASSWKKPGTEPAKYSKIIVVALVRNEDKAFREKMEQHLADDLKKLGYMASPSYKEFGDGLVATMSESEAVQKLKSSGADAVVTIVLLNKHTEKRYYPGHSMYAPADYYHQGFGQYYTTMRQAMRDPSYFVENLHYRWESNLYELGKDELVYSAQTDTFDPASAETLGHEYGLKIAKSLVKKGVLEKEHKALKAF